MSSDPKNILLVEDDQKTAQALKRGLMMEGYQVSLSFSGAAGLARIRTEPFDLLVLDWMLPEKSGIEVLQSVRNAGMTVPTLLLTARDTIEDRVQGLDCGADDYLVKPFAFAELLARIRSLLRRAVPVVKSGLQGGNLHLDLPSRRAWQAHQEIMLTPREFDVLVYLLQNEGQMVTRQMMAQNIWREPNRATSLDNVIDVHIGRLRKKLDGDSSEHLIRTVRGVGFLFTRSYLS